MDDKTSPLKFDETGKIVTGCNRNATNVVIPEGVTVIDKQAFEFCSSLISIEIPDSVKWISDQAFHRCTSLTSIKIPNGVRWIPEDAFSGCIYEA